MKYKVCTLCKKEESLMFRIKVGKGKAWIFVCESCCKESKKIENYVYGGTWKGT